MKTIKSPRVKTQFRNALETSLIAHLARGGKKTKVTGGVYNAIKSPNGYFHDQHYVQA
ncbi:hypothetical protein [Rhizobacter sp. Root404]|uniref:hypothetical protein n=1 Tax=Rhizobacter sp. Root404 TaxID=1736528 RepID=UPI000AAB174F|nr:hypothetical protein [Rhizobacter sp. Root404]